MADNPTVNGVVVAGDDVGGGIIVQRVKLNIGADGTGGAATDVAAANPLPVAQTSSAGAYGAVSIGTSAAVVKASKASRKSILVQNNHGSNDLYVGFDASVTTANGLHLGPGEAWADEFYTGAVYAVASAASTDVRYLEVG